MEPTASTRHWRRKFIGWAIIWTTIATAVFLAAVLPVSLTMLALVVGVVWISGIFWP